MSSSGTQAPAAPSARRLTLGSGLNLAARIASAVLGIGVAAMLSRQLGPADYGTFTTALGLVTIAVTLTDFGTNAVAVREMAGAPSRRSQLAGGLLAARAVLAITLSIPLIAGVMIVLPAGAPRVAGLIVAGTLLLGIVGALQAVVQADLRPEVVAVLVLYQGISWFAAVALIVQLDGGLIAMAIAFGAASVSQAVVTLLLVGRFLTISFEGYRREARRLLRIALPLGVAGMLTTAYYRFDAILVFELAGAEEAGYYNAAYRFIDTLQVVPGTLFLVLSPLIAARRGRSQDIQGVFALALTLLVAVALPLVVIGVLLADDLITLVYSTSFAPSAGLLAVLMLAFLSICFGYLWSGLLLADGPLRIFTVVAGGAAALSVGANALLIPHWGASAAAWVTVATEWGVSGVLGVVCVRHFRLAMPVGRITRCLASALVMAVVVFFVRDLGLLTALSCGLVAYAGCIVGLKGVTVRDVKALLGERRVIQECA